MYVARFDHDAQQWKSIYPFRDGRERPVPWSRERFIRSGRPWWPDPNHDIRADGTLGVNLVAYLYSRDLLPNVHDREIDLRHARLEFRIRGNGLALGGAELVFWVQARPKGFKHFVNLALTGRPITPEAASGDWTGVVLELDPDAEWTCLGAGPLRHETYGCATPGEVLSDVNRDFGFILYPVPLDKSADRAPRGSISLDDILLTYRLNARRPEGGSSPRPW